MCWDCTLVVLVVMYIVTNLASDIMVMSERSQHVMLACSGASGSLLLKKCRIK